MAAMELIRLTHFARPALYAARILKGEKPADLPVLQASKDGLSSSTSRPPRRLGLDRADRPLLAAADEVIE